MNRWLLPALLVMLTCVVVFLVPIGEEVGTGLDGEDDAGARHDPEAPTLAGSGGVGVSPERVPRRRDWREPPPPFKAWFLEASVTTVNTETPEPIAGAKVVVYLQVGWDYERIAEGASGPDGNVSIDLRFLSKRSRTQLGLARLVAYVSAAGHVANRGQPYELWHLLGSDLEPTQWWFPVRLARGRALRGRVTRETGEPIHYAQVLLWGRDSDVGEPEGQPTFTDPDGRYALPVASGGTYRVGVQRRGYSAFRSKPIVVNSAEVLPALDISLISQAVLPGVVRYEDGTPVADFTFDIAHPALEGDAYFWLPRVGPLSVQTDGLGGFTTVLPATTDYVPPIFEYARIPSAEFSVVVPGLRSKDTGFDPTSQLLELTLPAHRLRVRLRDDQGAPLRAQKVSLHLDKPHRRSMSGVTDTRGEVSLFAPPGAKGTLRILRSGNALLTVPVRVQATGNESTMVVDVPDRAASGSLGFKVRTQAGGALFPFTVRIQTTDGVEVGALGLTSDEDRIILPPGAFKVTVSSNIEGPWADTPHFWTSLRLEDPVHVHDGGEEIIEVLWRSTAALALRITAEGVGDETLQDSRVLIEPIGGARRTLSLRPRFGSPREALDITEWMYSTSLYPPGLYRLTFEAKGYRSVTREVRLHDGRVSRIEIALERAP